MFREWLVYLQGITTVNRAVVNTLDTSNGIYNLLVEGYGLRSVMAVEGFFFFFFFHLAKKDWRKFYVCEVGAYESICGGEK